jgi:hypothetical protein
MRLTPFLLSGVNEIGMHNMAYATLFRLPLVPLAAFPFSARARALHSILLHVLSTHCH